MSQTSSQQLIARVLDPGSYESWDSPPEYGELSPDYAASLARARERSGVDEAVVTGAGCVLGSRVAFILGEFNFLGGSIGAATARRIIAGIERATAEGLPLLISPASGGTRMQEGTPAFALMVSITTAVYRHKDAHLPFLVYLRNPTMGGVMASWGSAGHFTFAEPGARLGFLGPRVVELTTGTPLPAGVQEAENLAAHGIIDGVLAPEQLRQAVHKIVEVLWHPQSKTAALPTPPYLTDPAALAEEPAWEAILRTRKAGRPGGAELLKQLSAESILLSGSGDGACSPALQVAISRIGSRPVVLLVQDRHAQPPLGAHPLGPAALKVARRGIRLAHELQLPLVSIIDTPGAELSAAAEQGGLAGGIARTLGDLVDVDVPTVSVLLGQGCGGGALALLPADRVLALESAWLSPLPPEGASAIMFRDTSHAPQLMEAQKVSARELLRAGIVDAVVGETGQPPAQLIGRLLETLDYTLSGLEQGRYGVGRAARFARYTALGRSLR